MKKIALFIVLLSWLGPTQAQSEDSGVKPMPQRKGSFYLYWGYNRSAYTRSDLHFHGPDYDFTIIDAKAKDRPSPWSSEYYNINTLSIPQYVYRLGYYLNDRLCVSAGLDHMKYVMVQDQPAKVKGYISSAASAKYAGNYEGQSVVMSGDFLQFEHSDGLNLATVDVSYLYPLYAMNKDKIVLNWNIGGGGFFMITKTRSYVFDKGQDNKFHLSGLTAHLKAGPRIEFWNRFFIGAETKVGYTLLPWILLDGPEKPQRASHKVAYIEGYGVAGFYFRFWKRKD
ncbi:MAG: hypothetical protein R2813_13270 [Flavobacteriales bacterium]